MNDDELERLLRSSLEAEASGVQVHGDGLALIRERVSTSRRRWWVPVSSLSAAAAVAVVALVLVQSGRPGDDSLHQQPLASGGSSLTATPSASATTASPTTPASHRPSAPATSGAAATSTGLRGTVWPFPSAAAVAEWQRGNGAGHTAYGTAVRTAEALVTDFLGVHEDPAVTGAVVSGDGDTKLVALSSHGEAGDVVIARVRLARLGDPRAGTRPWGVVAATSDDFTVTSPRADAGRVRSPVTVAGQARQPHTSIRFEVRDIASPHQPLGSEVVPAGADEPYRGSVPFAAPRSANPALVATTRSDADGALRGLVVVRLVTSTKQTLPAGPLVGVASGRVAVYSDDGSSVVRYLTPAAPGGGVTHVDLVGRTVLYDEGSGSCGSAIWSVPLAGGTRTRRLQSSTEALTAPRSSPDGHWTTYQGAECESGTTTVYLYEPGQDSPRAVGTASAAVVSAVTDGGRVAWLEVGSGNPLHVVASDGATVATVAAPDGCEWRSVTADTASSGFLAGAVCSMASGHEVIALPVSSGGELGGQVGRFDGASIGVLDVDSSGQWLLFKDGGASIPAPLAYARRGSSEPITLGGTERSGAQAW